MKKLLLLLIIVFGLQSCQAQFRDVEPKEPTKFDFIGTVKYTDEEGSLIQGKRLSFQVDVPLELDVQYRCIIEVDHHFDRRKVITGRLKGYHITPLQSWKNIVEMFKDHDLPLPEKKNNQ